MSEPKRIRVFEPGMCINEFYGDYIYFLDEMKAGQYAKEEHGNKWMVEMHDAIQLPDGTCFIVQGNAFKLKDE